MFSQGSGWHREVLTGGTEETSSLEHVWTLHLHHRAQEESCCPGRAANRDSDRSGSHVKNHLHFGGGCGVEPGIDTEFQA